MINYERGRKAYESGKPRTANPHPIDTPAYEEWDIGWDDGADFTIFLRERGESDIDPARKPQTNA